MSLIKMIEHSIPLTDKQRTKLLELVMEETTKIRGDSHLQQYVSIQAATKLSEETLASVLDAAQLATFRQLQKHWETNLPFLNQMIKQPANEAGEEWLNVLR
jgi:F0F1-type ATP synthase delta subunit